KGGDLASPCCDTITYGDVSFDSSGLMVLKSDPGLNSIFINIDVSEYSRKNFDSVIFQIHNPIEQSHQSSRNKSNDLTYRILASPYSASQNYFKENDSPFNETNIRFYNPLRQS